MSAKVEEPISPLTPSRLGTPLQNMTDPLEPPAWDDISAALELDIFGTISTDPDGNHLFPPIPLPAFPAPDLNQTKANVREPPKNGTAPVHSTPRGYRNKRNGYRANVRKNKKERRTFEKPPYVVDGQVDKFPRLKSVSPVQESNTFNRAAYGGTTPARRFRNKQPVDQYRFRSRGRNNSEFMPGPKGFNDIPTTSPVGWWNAPAFPGIPFGAPVPPVPRYAMNKAPTQNIGSAGLPSWLPRNPALFYNNPALSGQFMGFQPGFGSMPHWPPMFPQMVFPQGNQFMPQGLVKPTLPNGLFPERNPTKQQRRTTTSHAAPTEIIEMPPEVNDRLPPAARPDNHSGGFATNMAQDNRENDFGPAPGSTRSGAQNPKSVEAPVQAAAGRRQVPDLELLKRTLEDIKRGNALRRTKQARKTRTPHSDGGPKKNGSAENQKTPFRGLAQGPIPSEPQDVRRHPRLTARGGIQKPPGLRPNAGLQSGASKFNRDWRPVRYGDAANYRTHNWMQSASGHENTSWRRNESRKIWRGGFRNNGYRHGGGQRSEHRNGRTGGLWKPRKRWEN